MPQGDKSKYTDKQERKAEHIAEGYEDRGVSNYLRSVVRPYNLLAWLGFTKQRSQ